MRRFFLMAIIVIAVFVLIGASPIASISSALSSTGTPVTALDSAPIPVIMAHPFQGHAPLQVEFKDKSVYSPTSWSWDFGDGCTSTEQNPVHVYTGVGRYTVSLTASNNAGSNKVSYMDYINVIKGARLQPIPIPSASPSPTPTPTPSPTPRPTATPQPTPMIPWKPMPPM
jgi:PKD repeat protein